MKIMKIFISIILISFGLIVLFAGLYGVLSGYEPIELPVINLFNGLLLSIIGTIILKSE